MIFRILLVVVNALILIVGILLFVAGLVLKFSTLLDSVYKSFTDNGFPSYMIEYVSYLFYVVVAIGVLVALYGVFGVLAFVWGNRVVLILYIISVLLTFLTHAAVLITVVAVTAMMLDYIKTFFQSFWTPITDEINALDLSVATVVANLKPTCQSSYGLFSTYLKCCDFNNPILLTACCPTSFTGRCPDAVIGLLSTYIGIFVNMPLGIAVGVEFLTLAASIFVLIKIWIYKKKLKKERMTGKVHPVGAKQPPPPDASLDEKMPPV
jgi:hypothetical protein